MLSEAILLTCMASSTHSSPLICVIFLRRSLAELSGSTGLLRAIKVTRSEESYFLNIDGTAPNLLLATTFLEAAVLEERDFTS